MPASVSRTIFRECGVSGYLWGRDGRDGRGLKIVVWWTGGLGKALA